MDHKFYYYEYSDDGGMTWTFGDYRKHLISIIDITKDNPYQVRIRNEKDEDVNWDFLSDAREQLECIRKILEKL